MKLSAYLLMVLTSLTLSFSSFASIVLNLPHQSYLIAINGEKAQGNKRIVLPNGINQIALRYEGEYKENNYYRPFQSNIIVLKFSGKDDHYNLNFPYLLNKEEADLFNRSPTLTLTDKQQEPVSFSQGLLLKAGLQIGRDYIEELAQYNQANHAASMPAKRLLTADTKNSGVNFNGRPTIKVTQATGSNKPTYYINVPETMLRYWYQRADSETRDMFKQQISK